jgi:hypothetical protein
MLRVSLICRINKVHFPGSLDGYFHIEKRGVAHQTALILVLNTTSCLFRHPIHKISYNLIVARPF